MPVSHTKPESFRVGPNTVLIISKPLFYNALRYNNEYGTQFVTLFNNLSKTK